MTVHSIQSDDDTPPLIPDDLAESWRAIPGWEGYYEVSDLGRVRSLARRIIRSDGRPRTVPELMLKPVVYRNRNRRAVYLVRNRSKQRCLIAVLVLQAFVGPRPPGYVGCHNDGDSMNDVLTNLRWDTISGNSRDSVRHGTHNMVSRTHCPLGHLLAEPNLVASEARRGRRKCRACNTALAVERRARMVGHSYDMQYESDRIYARRLQQFKESA